MLERGVLFVGSGPFDLSLLAEATALEQVRSEAAFIPARFYSASLGEVTEIDPVLVRALKRSELDATGLSKKPVALYALDGAPALAHIVCLDCKLPGYIRASFPDHVSVETWSFGPVPSPKAPPGVRYAHYLERTLDMSDKLRTFIDVLRRAEPVLAEHIARTA